MDFIKSILPLLIENMNGEIKEVVGRMEPASIDYVVVKAKEVFDNRAVDQTTEG